MLYRRNLPESSNSDSDSDSNTTSSKCPKCGGKKRDYGASFHIPKAGEEQPEDPIVEICPCFGITISGQRKLLTKCLAMKSYFENRKRDKRQNRPKPGDLKVDSYYFDMDIFTDLFHIEQEWHSLAYGVNRVPVHRCTTEYIGLPVLHQVAIRGLQMTATRFPYCWLNQDNPRLLLVGNDSRNVFAIVLTLIEDRSESSRTRGRKHYPDSASAWPDTWRGLSGSSR